MARTTADAVKTVLMQDYDSRRAPSLTAFIDTASAVVDRVEACAANKGKALSGGELELVERWLAAHFYAMSDQPYSSRMTERASGAFQGQTGMALDATKYGQTAQTVDYSGCLAAIGKRKTAGLVWLGKPVGDQLDWQDRNPGGR